MKKNILNLCKDCRYGIFALWVQNESVLCCTSNVARIEALVFKLPQASTSETQVNLRQGFFRFSHHHTMAGQSFWLVSSSAWVTDRRLHCWLLSYFFQNCLAGFLASLAHTLATCDFHGCWYATTIQLPFFCVSQLITHDCPCSLFRRLDANLALCHRTTALAHLAALHSHPCLHCQRTGTEVG